MSAEELPSVSTFITRCQQGAVATAIIAWRCEWGPEDRPLPATVHYGLMCHCRLLAYDQGTIISCEVPNGNREALYAELSAAGLQVEERSRNLTQWGTLGL